MTILHLTDLHLFAEPERTLMGWATEASFETVLEAALAEAAPDAVLLTGDLAQDGRGATYARLAMRLRALGRPCLWLPGNHDHAAVMADALAPFPWMRCGTLDLDGAAGWRLLALDTSTPDGDHGVLAVAELQRLDAALRAAPARPTLVALHHQPTPVGAPWLDAIGLRNADAFWRVVDRYAHVRAVVFGHVHQEVERVHRAGSGDVAVLATPATCFQFAPGLPDFALDTRAPGYRLLELLPGGSVRTRVRRVAVDTACLPTAAGY